MKKTLYNTFIILVFQLCNLLIPVTKASPGNTVCDISNTFRSDNVTEIYADCSNQNLTDVPDDLPANITCLNLSGNNISAINGTVWKKYPLLKKLSLARNRLATVQGFYFTYLTFLEKLDLSLNFIRYLDIDTFSFLPMKSLTYLDIKQSLTDIWPNETYPKALQYVPELATLNIDGLSQKFAFSLPKLKELYMSGDYGRCYVKMIDGNTFENLVALNNLFIANCPIEMVEFNAFKPLSNLQSLDISCNINLQMKSLPNITSGFNNSRALKRLNINNLYDHTKFDFCASLLAADLKYLYNTSVELLLIENNNLIRMEVESVHLFPKNLKYVSVHHNMFLYGPYLQYLPLSTVLWNLLYFDISHMVAANQPLSDWNSRADLPIMNGCESMFTRAKVGDYFSVIDNRLTKYDITPIQDIDDKSGNSGFQLQYLDLSENIPEMIHRSFGLFNKGYLSNLKVLNVSQNFLGYPLYSNDSFFQELTNLRTLDLRANHITQLSPTIFKPLRKLQTLILANNRLSNLSFPLQDMPNLKYLDLSFNNFEYIPEASRKALERIGNVTIDIRNNSLKCSCDREILDFLEWIISARIQVDHLDDTLCYFDNLSHVILANLNYNALYHECFPPTYFLLILCSSLFLTGFLLVGIAGVVYRYKWNLRYLYYVAKLNFKDGQYRILNTNDYVRDVFVSYADEDRRFVCDQILPELENKGNISLLLHDRDFWPGEWVADNIIRAIRKTRKTLIVLTNAYLSREWCKFEMNMARHEVAYTGRNILCVILKENLDLNKAGLPLEIIDILKDQTYLEFPVRENDLEGFWDRLRYALNEGR